MRYIAIILLGSSLALLALSFNLIQNLSGRRPNPPVIVVPLDPTSVQLQDELTNQRATAQAELQQLELDLSRQQAELQTRKAELKDQVRLARQQLSQLQAQQQIMATRLADLEAAQASQAITATSELEAARGNYLPRREDLQARLETLQAELATVETQLEP
jgi:flagellar basal body-associated protein FliL